MDNALDLVIYEDYIEKRRCCQLLLSQLQPLGSSLLAIGSSPFKT
jgi:hypothetical protein